MAFKEDLELTSHIGITLNLISNIDSDETLDLSSPINKEMNLTSEINREMNLVSIVELEVL